MYVVIWEFHAKAGLETEFRKIYGADGLWAKFFRRSDGYLGTELLEDEVNSLRFLTIDRWATEASYLVFHSSHEAEYRELDRQCDALTAEERKLGAFLG
jgi:quinol monooxygenase YgiN